MEERKFFARELKRSFQVAFSLALFAVPSVAQAQQVKISIADAEFTGPLLEALASKYHQEYPESQVEIVNSSSADASVSLDQSDPSEGIGRFFVLPIVNSQNEILKDRKVRKGLDDKLARRIFVERDYLETLDASDAGEKQLPGTVYALTGSKAFLTNLFAESLHIAPSQLKGKKILGRDENALTAVQYHPDAIGFNVASLIYDQKNRLPVQGVTVLDVDLDHNGRISDEERNAVSNLDALTAYLDRVDKPSIPVGTVSIRTKNPEVMRFVSWVSTHGQKLVSQYGYLKPESALTAQR